MEKHRHRNKTSWGKRLLIGFGGLALVLVVLYFVGTSSFFLKSVILPKVGASLNSDITVASASISPFSQVRLSGLKLTPKGEETLVTAEQVVVRYSLMDIIGGNINVSDLTLNAPVITLVQDEDGSSNLDPLLKEDESASDDKSSSDEPLQIDVRNVKIQNATLRQTQKLAGGGVSTTELDKLNLTVDRLANGQSGSLKLDGGLTMSSRSGPTNDLLHASLSGGYNIALTKDLLPESAKGAIQVQVSQAQGAYETAAGMNISLDADLTPTEIRDLALRVSKAGQELAQIQVSGPFNAETMEGNLKIEAAGLDRDIFNVVMAGQGYDFNNSTLNFASQVGISQSGNFFAINGGLTGQRISITSQELTTPELGLDLQYQLTVNLADQTAVLQKFNLAGDFQNKELLRAALDRQMNLSWGTTVHGFKDAALQFSLTNFNVQDWRAVLGTNLQSGVAGVRATVSSQQDGKLLALDVAGQISELSMMMGTNPVQNVQATFTANGTVEQMNTVNLGSYTLGLSQNNAPVLQANGAARYALDTADISAQLTAEGSLPRALQLNPVAGLRAEAGDFKFSATYSDASGKQKAHGQFALQKFTGAFEEYQFDNFQTALEYNVAIENEQLDIQRAAGTFSRGFAAGGSLDLTGRYHLGTGAGKFTYKVLNLNENTLAPFLAPSLGENKLVSISLNASGEAALDPQGENAVKTDVQITNWRVEDPAGKLPKEPLSVEMKLDAGMRENLVHLRQAMVQLTPTERAKNALQLKGKVDLSTTNATPSVLDIASESFDVTPYYQMFAGAPAETPAEASAPAAQPEAEVEPEAMELPFGNFTANLKMDRFFLNDLAISNWVGTIAIRTNNVIIEPFQLTLNGGPIKVNGKVNVGTPGYQYDLSFNAENVPVKPVMDFLGDTNSGPSIEGDLFANTRIRGAGITGPSLQKNLSGTANFSVTNMNMQVVGPKITRILRPIAAITRSPELLQTPINWVSGQTQITNGVVAIESIQAASEAFFAHVQGTIQLASVISNSTLNLPVDLSLRRSLAAKAHLMPQNTPEDAKYAKLPRFVTIKGTLGEPDSDINELALGVQVLNTARSIGGSTADKVLSTVGDIRAAIVPGGSTNAAGESQNLGRTLGGALKGIIAGGGPAEAGTNAPPAEEGEAKGIGGALKGLLGGGAKAETNQPSTNKPANPLDNLFRRRSNN